MAYEGNRAGPNTDGRVHRGSVDKPQCRAVPGMALPPTVLVTELDTGALVILNRDMASLCMCMMNRHASVTQQRACAERLIAAGKRLQWRTVAKTAGVVIDGEAFTNSALPEHALELHWAGIYDWTLSDAASA